MNDVDFRDMLSNMTAYHEGTAHLSEAMRCANAIIKLLEILQQLQSANIGDNFHAFTYLDIKEFLVCNWIEIFAEDTEHHRRTIRNLKTFDYKFLGYETQEIYWRAIKRSNEL